MNNIGTLTMEVYSQVADVILLRNYNENNIRKLLSAIFVLIKIDDNHRYMTIQFIRNRVNRRIHQRINNLTNIFDILYELIHISNNSNRSLNRQNRYRNNNNRNVNNNRRG